MASLGISGIEDTFHPQKLVPSRQFGVPDGTVNGAGKYPHYIE
jgi:hypothetical protein